MIKVNWVPVALTDDACVRYRRSIRLHGEKHNPGALARSVGTRDAAADDNGHELHLAISNIRMEIMDSTTAHSLDPQFKLASPVPNLPRIISPRVMGTTKQVLSRGTGDPSWG